VINRQSGAIPPDELIAALDGEASPDVLERLRAAPDSAAELDELARLQTKLQRAFHRFDCPNPQELGEYALDLLTPERRLSLAIHLQSCPCCADEIAEFRGFLVDVAAPIPASPVVRVRRLVASLFTPTPGVVFTVRGEETDTALNFRADDVQLRLDRGPGMRQGTSELTGLIWRESGDATPVEGKQISLIAPDSTARSTTIDDLGNFAFANLVDGTYHLEITLGDDLVATEDFPVGH
jgi:hypothetical protein